MANCRVAAAAFLLIVLVGVSEAGRPGSFKEFISNGNGDGTIWAVLVAGSMDWWNYRHQADVCHAYQVLKKGGLKDENIVVFMYDDIANNSLNPNPGVIINSPQGPNVYAGVPKDYTGDDVTTENFLAVLMGNSSGVKGGSGKVVDSKPEDRIFIYYSAHGGPGFLSMPVGGDLPANVFIEALTEKHARGAYDEMVIYVEACESGSIFEGLLPNDLNIYVTTASNATEDSYATYCPVLDDESLGLNVCLGDTYSVSWMEDSESEDLTVEKLGEQYSKVKDRTWGNQSETLGYSHVMQYGTLRISEETVSRFQGSSPKISAKTKAEHVGRVRVVNQRDADLHAMWYRYHTLGEKPQEKAEQLEQIKAVMACRASLDAGVVKIVEHVFGHEHGEGVVGYVRSRGLPLVDDWRCLKAVVETFERYCGLLGVYGKKHTRTFANMCNNGATVAAVEDASKATCKAELITCFQ